MKIKIFVMLLFSSMAHGQLGLIIKADSLLLDSVEKEQFVGVVAGFSINDTIIWKSSAGFQDLENRIHMNDSVLLRTASIAKSMTAVAVMQLFEEGKLELDVPIQTYLPEFPKKKEGDIMVRQLLNHTSGLSAYQSSKETESTVNYESLSEAAKVFKDRALLHKPGTAYYYTTYGYLVLGMVIEQVSGISFEAYMKKYVWEKAGMQQTGIEHFSKIYPNKTELYHKNNRGKIKKADANNLSNRIPGGGFYTTTADMLKFGNAIIANTLIQKSTLKLMLEISEHTNEGNPYGMGWFMYGGEKGPSLVFGHSGEQTGASSQLLIIPGQKIVIIVMGNTSGSWKQAVTMSMKLVDWTVPYEKSLRSN